MVVEIKRLVCDGHVMKWLFASGLAWLEHHKDKVNKLNVFPVPDGDTGSNMLLTMRKGYESIKAMDDAHVGIIVNAMAEGSLLGARGNSGVILSQLLHGFSQTVRGHEVFDAELLALACDSAVEMAYDAVTEPTEGTILTVARESTEVLKEVAQKNRDLVDCLGVMLEAARDSLAKTPELLPVLKSAGVVDSGGQGLVFILEGMWRVLNGQPVEINTNGHAERQEVFAPPEHEWENELPPDDERGYGYDVQFLMRGAAMDVQKVRGDIEAMGWSALVVGSPELIKVHVHVYNPGEPINYAVQNSQAIDDVVVENMQLQYEAFRQRQAEKKLSEENEVEGVAVIAVASGDGLKQLFHESMVARIIHGGQTMNPSVDDFVQAIKSLPNDEIIILPNNRNIIKAAQQAAKIVENKRVQVVETVTVPEGIGAMLGYLDMQDAGLDDVHGSMADYAAGIITAQVTNATRDAKNEHTTVSEGQYIGILSNDLVVGGDALNGVVRDLLYKANAADHELITLYYGKDVEESEIRFMVEMLESEFDDQRFEVVYGGQPLYPLLIGIE